MVNTSRKYIQQSITNTYACKKQTNNSKKHSANIIAAGITLRINKILFVSL